MKNFLKSIIDRESFFPSYVIGIWINPFFISRRGLSDGIVRFSSCIKSGVLLDVGCGSKPYESCFDVDKYIGIDVRVSGHNHSSSKVDQFYDGKNIPFENDCFDHVFSSQVFEHVLDLDDLLGEINRVLKAEGTFFFTCPFVWDEHEQPFDYRRFTSFFIDRKLERHGFALIRLEKSSGYIATVLQLLSAYIYQHVLPENRYIKRMLTPVFVAPINILAVVLSALLPSNKDLYHDNIVVAKKLG